MDIIDAQQLLRLHVHEQNTLAYSDTRKKTHVHMLSDYSNKANGQTIHMLIYIRCASQMCQIWSQDETFFGSDETRKTFARERINVILSSCASPCTNKMSNLQMQRR